MKKIIGIDPGLAATGIGIVSGRGGRLSGYSYGCILTSREETLPCRLEKIFSGLERVLAEEAPHLMVMEDIFSLGKYPRSGISLGQVSGVILLAAAQAGIPAVTVAVREAKQVLTGNGNAGKEQMEKAVRGQIGQNEPIHPFHAADALAMALIGLFRYSHCATIQGSVKKEP